MPSFRFLPMALLCLCLVPSLFAQTRTMHITSRYLNIPIGRDVQMREYQISHDGAVKREIPLQLAEQSVDYWIFIDVSEFKGQTITLSGPSTPLALNRIYQANQIHDAASLYKESDRPQFHFTVKRGWNNDVNGPLFYKGQYHLFWQAFPFGTEWDTGFMYWGHAVSKDLLHWHELPPALMVDRLGAAWSGSSLIDHENVGGFGKDALVLFYTAFDRVTKKQVQCIAYSTDNGATFSHFAGNPVIDSNAEVGSNDTRDPKVFWYQPTRHWVMVLFEKDGMSFYTSQDMKHWTRHSHVKGLYECPDLFELPIDGDSQRKKWVLHGGSTSYLIGSFDGETFTPESPMLQYAEGGNSGGNDLLYAAQSFAEMPGNRRVQMGWGRVDQKNMPFNQMLLFPTDLRLATTRAGVRLLASPIPEIARLHRQTHIWSSLSAAAANQRLSSIAPGPLHVKLMARLDAHDQLDISYDGQALATIKAEDLTDGQGSVELLIDKSVAEIFVDGGVRYILRQLPQAPGHGGLQFTTGHSASTLAHLDVYELKSIWK